MKWVKEGAFVSNVVIEGGAGVSVGDADESGSVGGVKGETGWLCVVATEKGGERESVLFMSDGGGI